MKPKNKVTFIVFLLILVLLTACQPKEEEKVVLVVWHGDSESVARITEELIVSEFNVQYPNIEVRYELAPDPFKEKLLTTIPAGTGPDVFEWNHDWIGSLVEADLLQPIDDLVTPEIEGKYVASAFGAGQYDGALYTLPISAEAGALAYNKALLGNNAVPQTTEEFVALMEALQTEGGYAISYPWVPFLVSGYVHAFGGWFWSDETNSLGVSNPETIAAMEWMLETFKPYMTDDPTWDPQSALFNEGDTPFAVNGPWMTGGWSDAGIDFGIAPLPEIDEIGEMPSPYIGVKSIYMSANTENREAAFNFMVWATTSRERILLRATELGYIPVLKEVMELSAIQNDPVISGFASQVALGIPMSSSAEMVAVWGPFDEALSAMFTGLKTPEEALNDAQAAIEAAIAELE